MRNSRAFVPASRLLGSTALGLGGMDLPRSIDELFERFTGSTAGSSRASQRPGWTPAVDVVEHDAAFELTLELPGVDPEQVEVTFDRDALVVKGHKGAVPSAGPSAGPTDGPSDEASGGDPAPGKAESPVEAKVKAKAHREEIVRGAFERRFTFSVPIDSDGVEAAADNGVLVITVAKAVEAQPKRIAVRRS